jgi:hypothetical protein
VNDEGGHEGHAGSYFTLEREWKNGDAIKVEFARKLRVVEGYHQSAAVVYGAQVMAFVPADTWSVALCGEPEINENGEIAGFLPFAHFHPDFRDGHIGLVKVDEHLSFGDAALSHFACVFLVTPLYWQVPCRAARIREKNHFFV